MESYPSKLLEQAVGEFARLPGIGRKTAMRMVLHLLRQDPANIEHFGLTIQRLSKEIRYCSSCYNISENDLCDICLSNKRIKEIICVVEDVRDVMAVENTCQFTGIYHILGGLISPMDGIGPHQLNIDSLIERIGTGSITEVILALPATIEGDTTNFYLFKRLAEFNISITAIARGVSFGDELEYTDEITLGRSILNRIPYQNSMVAR